MKFHLHAHPCATASARPARLIYRRSPLPLHSEFDSRTRAAILCSQLSSFPAMASKRVLLLLLVVLFSLDCCITSTIPRPYDPSLNDEVLTAKKRPFCNAFTGCGRKRSEAPAQELFRQRQFVEDTVPYIDSENIMDHQIIAGAKLWEALQEASAELSRRKQKYSYNE